MPWARYGFRMWRPTGAADSSAKPRRQYVWSVVLGGFLQFRHDLVEVEAGGLLSCWEVGQCLEHLGDICLRRDE